jgi:hypothetical protein
MTLETDPVGNQTRYVYGNDADPPVNRGRQHGQGRNRQVHLFDPPGY